jgi:glycine/D-amino acid oxidase-like deaminating enzyme
MFLESFYGIAGAGCISLCINYKLTERGFTSTLIVDG